MKKTHLIFALLLMVSISAQVYAEEPASLTQPPTQTVTILQEQTAETETPTLKDVRIASENGQQRIIKT